MRWFDRVLAFLPIFLILVTSRGVLNASSIELKAGAYHYPLATWEVSHFMGKWFYKAYDILPGDHRNIEQRRSEVMEFMTMADEVNRLEWDLRRAVAHSQDEESIKTEKKVVELRAELARRSARVEEILEGEISSTLKKLDFASRVGVIFPPVDFAFDQPPKLLIVSPRSRIETTDTVLLHPKMEMTDIEALERNVMEDGDLSALIEDTGGVSFYPSVMSNTYGLRGTLSVASHEWLHQYLFFRPLGRNYVSSSEMSTLNETLANMAGEEIGDLTYEVITGEKVMIYQPAEDPSEPPSFDFNKEMRKTRQKVDELLSGGKVDDAEAYMEERRLVFVEEGYYIRKLNQAYFAFHGTYADTPASTSPIHAELQMVRTNSASVADFIKTVSRFGSYADFKAYATTLSVEPTTSSSP